ncbi:hypothetical protein RX880_07995 [Pseudomonas syringae pv. actinidiae]|nr:hypothetical protein [Pseudomonas syringae pv. actinidiae]MDU8099204.1 hypothetical protein [Pseudomonas syringae pv. actinidiae]MDU8115728.1 hypothetical protein [Pseudomonas syringae pv. actinidiae]MDU8131824.1 hypothetical protein [Pseudomonas syringae pv. actinidiae]MDU8153146.1 hypothetical protein [Pseudomonas syringae pv. actinidiae]
MRLDKNTIENIRKEVAVIVDENNIRAIANAKENLTTLEKITYKLAFPACFALPLITIGAVAFGHSVLMSVLALTVPVLIASIAFVTRVSNQCIAEAKTEDYIVDKEVRERLSMLQVEFSSFTNLPHFLSYHYHDVYQIVTGKRDWRELV